MIVKLVQIGNSQGIRIPKTLIEQCGLSGEVELELKDSSLVISASDKPRKGWREEFKLMYEQGDDILLDQEFLSNEFDEEWEW